MVEAHQRKGPSTAPGIWPKVVETIVTLYHVVTVADLQWAFIPFLALVFLTTKLFLSAHGVNIISRRDLSRYVFVSADSKLDEIVYFRKEPSGSRVSRRRYGAIIKPSGIKTSSMGSKTSRVRKDGILRRCGYEQWAYDFPIMEARIVCSGFCFRLIDILKVLEALVSALGSRRFKGYLKGFGGANTVELALELSQSRKFPIAARSFGTLHCSKSTLLPSTEGSRRSCVACKAKYSSSRQSKSSSLPHFPPVPCVSSITPSYC